MAAIRFEDVTKRFGATTVADALSLSIADGEFFTFLGPSGTGKSTLLHIVAGVEMPTSGRVFIGDRDVTGLPPQHRDVAMVFQTYALYPHLSVFENLAFPLRNRGVDATTRKREVERTAAVLGLVELLDKRPGELSGGQRQRVALGRALIRRPVAFLMDEPLSNLDAALRLEVREEIKRVHQAQRITTLYVTHDQEEAMALSQRIAVLRDGCVQQCDAPGGLYARPADTFVAKFVGMPPMNLVPAVALAGHPVVRDRLEGRAPQRVMLGLRPHDVEIGAGAQAGSFPLNVTLLEPAGAETWVIGNVQGTRLQGRLARRARVEAGGQAHATFAADAVHLFDAETGKRL
jgi:ABC-type sugar transport system ATPase subunit